MRTILALLVAIAFLAQAGCTRRKEIWIYTSLSKDVIGEMVDPLQAAVPDADVKWFQSATDTIAGRLSAEIENDNVKADLVLTSDPLWYAEMKQKGRLLPYESPAAKEVPASMRDPGNAFVAVRVPVMILAYNSLLMKPGELPERWKDLASPKFDRKTSMGSPLESPVNFVLLGTLSKLYGWEYFAELRRLGLVAEGTQSSVLTRLETGERPVGILPLDALFKVGARRGSVKPIYPLDGAVAIPGPIAILKDTDYPEISRKVYDWFFSPAAQALITRAGMYSPFPKSAPPEGAKPWAELEAHLIQCSPETLTEMLAGRDRIRAKFSEVVLH